MNWELIKHHKNELIQDAIAAKNLSYSPYSNFKVGAALLLDDGSHIQGANVENASYGCAICAERSAVVKMKTSPNTHQRAILAVAVSSDSAAPCTPCGICRQVLREFCLSNTVILMPGQDWRQTEQKNTVSSLEDLREVGLLVMDMNMLLPESFGPEFLRGDIVNT